MSKDSYRAEWETRTKIAMGERVGALKQFLFMQETAMVHLEERELIAYCKAYPLIFTEDKEFNDFLQETAIPVLILIGRGKWYRDTITDLSLALSSKKRRDDAEDAKDILEEKIE